MATDLVIDEDSAPKRAPARAHEFHLGYFTFHMSTLLIPSFCLAGCFLLGIILHYDHITATHCKNWEWLPSISSTIGNKAPEKYLWRAGMPLYMFPKSVLDSVHFFYNRNRWAQKKEVSNDPVWRALFFKFLNWGTLLTALIEDLSLLTLTVISSTDDFFWHEKGFISFVIFAHAHFVFFLWAFYESRGPFSAFDSKWFKRLVVNALAHFLLLVTAVGLYMRHQRYCEPGGTKACMLQQQYIEVMS